MWNKYPSPEDRRRVPRLHQIPPQTVARALRRRLCARKRALAPAQVHFHVQGRGLDGTIRRAAHIMLQQNLPFLHHCPRPGLLQAPLPSGG